MGGGYQDTKFAKIVILIAFSKVLMSHHVLEVRLLILLPVGGGNFVPPDKYTVKYVASCKEHGVKNVMSRSSVKKIE